MEAAISLTATEAHRLAKESLDGAETCLAECVVQIREAANHGKFEHEFSGFRNLAIKCLIIVRLQKAGFSIPDANKQAVSPKSPLVIKW